MLSSASHWGTSQWSVKAKIQTCFSFLFNSLHEVVIWVDVPNVEMTWSIGWRKLHCILGHCLNPSQSTSKHLKASQSIWMHLNASKPPHLPTHSISLPSASQSPSSPAGPWLRRPLPSLLLPNLPSASTTPPECTAPLVTKASQHSQSSPASLTFSTFHQLLHKWSYQWELI